MYWGYEDFEQLKMKNDINEQINGQLYNNIIPDYNYKINDINNQITEKIKKTFFALDYFYIKDENQ